MKTSPLNAPDYLSFVADLKTRIQSARISAARAVNRELILLYWDIGRGIVEKQQTVGWGDAVVERLAADLHAAFPSLRGFSVANLWRMKQIYLAHTSPEFLAQAVRELVASVPWGHHVFMQGKLTNPAARIYYLRATARFGWSRNVLLNQINAGAYERSLKEGKTHNFPTALPENLAEQAEEALKSSYNLEFLGIGRAVKERELEDRLTERLRDFILELGYGFCFVGRQHRLTLGRIDDERLKFAPYNFLPHSLFVPGNFPLGCARHEKSPCAFSPRTPRTARSDPCRANPCRGYANHYHQQKRQTQRRDRLDQRCGFRAGREDLAK